jgi:hypothetical protein
MTIALLSAALLGGSVGASRPAQAAVDVAIGGGGIAFGYTDGYWDREHHWHRWHSRHEAEQWRAANADHYYAVRHDRDRDREHKGWREERWWDNH